MSITTKVALCLAVVIGSGTAALAAKYDGDNNVVPGIQRQLPSSFYGAFASVRVPTTVRRSHARLPQRDGDGNRIPGVN